MFSTQCVEHFLVAPARRPPKIVVFVRTFINGKLQCVLCFPTMMTPWYALFEPFIGYMILYGQLLLLYHFHVFVLFHLIYVACRAHLNNITTFWKRIFFYKHLIWRSVDLEINLIYCVLTQFCPMNAMSQPPFYNIENINSGSYRSLLAKIAVDQNTK